MAGAALDLRMPTIRAVLFDFGGTLYDYATLAPAEAESLVELARWAGVDAEPLAVLRAHRAAMRRVFHGYLPRRFYLHRDLFRDALIGMLEDLGAAPQTEHLDRYRALQWQRHQRDFTLREGVVETLRALRAHGVHLGIVSNIDEDQLAHLLALGQLEPHFDSILSSEEARSCKPDRGIFTEALRRAGCGADEALFVGDTIAQDIAGANRAGMRSVLLWHRDDRAPPLEDPTPDHVIRRIPEVLELVANGT
jgi:putative hydrolase of the HAD superfamily